MGGHFTDKGQVYQPSMEEPVDQLELQFAHYQVDQLKGVSLDQRADELRVAISQIKDKSTHKKKYRYVHLPRVMCVILSVAHSNAEDERIFSLERKNSTEYLRGKLIYHCIVFVVVWK